MSLTYVKSFFSSSSSSRQYRRWDEEIHQPYRVCPIVAWQKSTFKLGRCNSHDTSPLLTRLIACGRESSTLLVDSNKIWLHNLNLTSDSFNSKLLLACPGEPEPHSSPFHSFSYLYVSFTTPPEVGLRDRFGRSGSALSTPRPTCIIQTNATIVPRRHHQPQQRYSMDHLLYTLEVQWVLDLKQNKYSIMNLDNLRNDTSYITTWSNAGFSYVPDSKIS